MARDAASTSPAISSVSLARIIICLIFHKMLTPNSLSWRHLYNSREFFPLSFIHLSLPSSANNTDTFFNASLNFPLYSKASVVGISFLSLFHVQFTNMIYFICLLLHGYDIVYILSHLG